MAAFNLFVVAYNHSIFLLSSSFCRVVTNWLWRAVAYYGVTMVCPQPTSPFRYILVI